MDCSHERRRVARRVSARVTGGRIKSFVRIGDDGSEHFADETPKPEDLPTYRRLVTCISCGSVLDRERSLFGRRA